VGGGVVFDHFLNDSSESRVERERERQTGFHPILRGFFYISFVMRNRM